MICQGTRDPFGTRDEVPGYALPPEIELFWIEDGDHDLKPRKSVAGFGFTEALDRVADRLAVFVRRASVQSNARI